MPLGRFLSSGFVRYEFYYWYENPKNDYVMKFFDKTSARNFLHRFLLDYSNIRILRRILCDDFYNCYIDLSRLRDNEVIEKIVDTLASRRLIVVVQEVKLPLGEKADVAKSEKEKVIEQVPPFKDKEKTWIEIQLIGIDGKAVADEKFKIIMTDGKEIIGTTDSNGFARFAEIEKGTCKISFINLDGAAWELV